MFMLLGQKALGQEDLRSLSNTDEDVEFLDWIAETCSMCICVFC